MGPVYLYLVIFLLGGTSSILRTFLDGPVKKHPVVNKYNLFIISKIWYQYPGKGAKNEGPAVWVKINLLTKQFSADTQVSLTEFESASEFIRNILNIKSSGKNVPNIKYRAKLHIFSISLRTQEYIYLHSDHSENLSGFWLWSLSNFFRQTWGLIFGSRCLSLSQFSISHFLKNISFFILNWIRLRQQ